MDAFAKKSVGEDGLAFESRQANSRRNEGGFALRPLWMRAECGTRYKQYEPVGMANRRIQ